MVIFRRGEDYRVWIFMDGRLSFKRALPEEFVFANVVISL